MHTPIETIRIVLGYLFKHFSIRQIAKMVAVSRETISKIKTLMFISELKYEELMELCNSKLEEKLQIKRSSQRPKKIQPNVEFILKELENHKDLSLTILWEEFYKETEGKGVGYTRFCNIIRQAQKNSDISQKQVYFPGEAVQIDYSGDPVDIHLPNGEIIKANIFVGVLPFSGLLFVYATPTQQTEDWLISCSKMFDKFKGVTEHIVCDNAKALITKNKNRIVKINPYFEEYLLFHNMAVLPARPRKPQDKGKGENGVKIAQKNILMRMRKEKFSSIEELNERLEYETDKYNRKKTQTFPNGRMVDFIDKEKIKLKPLPQVPFKVLRHYATVKVPLDYHITYLGNSYSIPHTYIKKNVDIKVVDNHIYIYHEKDLIAQHMIFSGTGKISTLDAHKTDNHRLKDHLSKESILSWAEEIGVNTLNYCNFIIKKDANLYNNLNYLYDLRDWTEQKGFIERLELALEVAHTLGLQNIARLKHLIENQSYIKSEDKLFKSHKNLRGPDYYKGIAKC